MYVRPLNSAIQLDGYLDDWAEYQGRMQVSDSFGKAAQANYRSHVGTYRKYLYAMFEVSDDKIVYRRPNSLSLDKSDHLRIVLRDREGQIRHYIVTTISPGWINAHRMAVDANESRAVAPELRIKGEWQQTTKGYNIEIRIPLSLIGDNLSFFIADVDDPTTREIANMTGSTESPDELGTIIIPSPQLEALLTRIARPASRTWVIDKDHRVIAVTGDLTQQYNSDDPDINRETDERDFLSGVVRLLYQLLLEQPTERFEDDLSTASRLQGKAFQSALEGKPATAWRETPDKRVRILTATYPVRVDGQTIGAIAIEETSNAILILQNRAMEILINLSVLTFFIAVLVLLGYATRLSFRIRRLRDQAEYAIGEDGRILNDFDRSATQDEIGDLSRSFSDMLSRLGEYNRYLESMASKLSHELRTPITIVRSSLDNLETAASNEAKQTYLGRARDGMARLSDILTRMSEATRLEQTLQSEQRQALNLCHLVENCIAGYRIAYPTLTFALEPNVKSNCTISGVAELIAQMLDKLVSNAVDFHAPSTPIVIRIQQLDNNLILSVLNQGQTLPEHMQDNLFESMVSVRSKKGETPHLGLGLYIVRLIVDFHEGNVRALNREDTKGVEIRITLPQLS
ncbi:MAG: proteobacterial dedicated sortase system histidine kinase, partial [Halobacteria archaeon]|nr:proteobacterial dedicated sortase system histidine kinase [Halobacteria archaeon]